MFFKVECTPSQHYIYTVKVIWCSHFDKSYTSPFYREGFTYVSSEGFISDLSENGTFLPSSVGSFLLMP